MPLEPVKHIRARFFHEVAEKEALAWLSAMVDSAEDLPVTKREPKNKAATTGQGSPASPTPAKAQPGKKTPDSPPLKTRIIGKKTPDKDPAS
jgi:hypothetical protein